MDDEELRGRAVLLRAAGRSRREIRETLGLRSDHRVGALLVGTAPPASLRRHRAKDDQRVRARELRAQGWTYARIAAELNVSTSSCSLWLRDMPHPVFERRLEGDQWYASWAPVLRRREASRQQTKLDAARELDPVTDRDILLAGAVAYWCEGAKSKSWRRHECVTFINSDLHLIRLFLRFLELVEVAPERLRLRVSIHETADADAAVRFWADIVGVPADRFSRSTIKRHRPLTKRRNIGEGTTAAWSSASPEVPFCTAGSRAGSRGSLWPGSTAAAWRRRNPPCGRVRY